MRTVFFFHIMKTAGMSLLKMFGDALGAGVYPSPREMDMNRAQRMPHAKPQCYLGSRALIESVSRGEVSLDGRSVVMGHYPWIMGPRLLKDPVMATFLRDPVARTMSMLDHRVRMYARGKTPEQLLDDEGFVERYVRDYQTKVFAANHIPIPGGTDVLHAPPPDDDGALARAVDRLSRTESVGLAERFGESVALLSRTAGIPLSGVREARENAGAWEPPTGAVRDRILKLVPRDVELYRIAVERFEKEVQLL